MDPNNTNPSEVPTQPVVGTTPQQDIPVVPTAPVEETPPVVSSGGMAPQAGSEMPIGPAPQKKSGVMTVALILLTVAVVAVLAYVVGTKYVGVSTVGQTPIAAPTFETIPTEVPLPTEIPLETIETDSTSTPEATITPTSTPSI
jgi:hypothetical protein